MHGTRVVSLLSEMDHLTTPLRKSFPLEKLNVSMRKFHVETRYGMSKSFLPYEGLTVRQSYTLLTIF